jgi:predicted RNA-binding protein with PUA-like domain
MDSNDQLKVLTERNEFLKPIVFKVFKTDKELDLYEKKNIKLFDEYYDNQAKIDKIKWDLMTPELQAEHEENIKLSKRKREGNLGI